MKTLFHHSYSLLQGAAHDFPAMYDQLIKQLKTTVTINRGRWQSEDVSTSDAHSTHELPAVTLIVSVPTGLGETKEYFKPDLPWAEDHFMERVSGLPLNPPPSYQEWPHHSAAQRDRFIRDGKNFDHTYPERFWPKWANGEDVERNPKMHRGIRFRYGDLSDVVDLLKKDPFTRQAYLPVWFPEDTGAVRDIRVPCTLGYHFIRNGPALDCNYFIRSCDIVRHFRNDIYMAARLMQWIVEKLLSTDVMAWTGNLNMHISNLHLFKGDAWRV